MLKCGIIPLDSVRAFTISRLGREMAMMESKQVPDIVIGRLPIYLRALTHLMEEGQQIQMEVHYSTSGHRLPEPQSPFRTRRQLIPISPRLWKDPLHSRLL